MKRFKNTLLFAGVLLIVAGCVQMGGMIAGLMTQQTSDLKDVAMQVRYIQNLYPKEAATTEVGYTGDLWKPGGNILAVFFTKRQGIGFYTINGVIKNNADTIPYVSNGVYGKMTDEVKPQPVDITMASGQKFSTIVKPIEPVKIKSVNGGSNVISFEKDLVLEFDNPKGATNLDAKAHLILDIMGTQSMVEFVAFKMKDKVVIPKEAFRNMPTLVPRRGQNYLLIERFKIEPVNREGIGACQVISQSWDCVPVTVEGEVDRIDYIYTKIETGEDDNKLIADFNKPNAYTGRMFNQAKKMALVSLSVRATKLKQSRTTSSSTTSYAGNMKTTTTTTVTSTRKFPTLPDAYWNSLLDNLYKEISGTLKKRYNIELIPMEKVTSSPTYQALEEIPDESSEVEVSKSYKGTKSLIPTTMSAMLGSVSSTFASDRPDARLLNELGVDGLVSVTLDLEMPWFEEAEKATLAPRLAIRVSGLPNGYNYGPTIYTQGVVHGLGTPISDAIMESGSFPGEFLEGVVRLPELSALINKALDDQAMKEKELGYSAIWALQK